SRGPLSRRPGAAAGPRNGPSPALAAEAAPGGSGAGSRDPGGVVRVLEDGAWPARPDLAGRRGSSRDSPARPFGPDHGRGAPGDEGGPRPPREPGAARPLEFIRRAGHHCQPSARRESVLAGVRRDGIELGAPRDDAAPALLPERDPPPPTRAA